MRNSSFGSSTCTQDEQPLAPLQIPPAILEDLTTLLSSQSIAVSHLELRSPSPIQTSCSQLPRWVWGIPQPSLDPGAIPGAEEILEGGGLPCLTSSAYLGFINGEHGRVISSKRLTKIRARNLIAECVEFPCGCICPLTTHCILTSPQLHGQLSQEAKFCSPCRQCFYREIWLREDNRQTSKCEIPTWKSILLQELLFGQDFHSLEEEEKAVL